jgi:hypothetical protein
MSYPACYSPDKYDSKNTQFLETKPESATAGAGEVGPQGGPFYWESRYRITGPTHRFSCLCALRASLSPGCTLPCSGALDIAVQSSVGSLRCAEPQSCGDFLYRQGGFFTQARRDRELCWSAFPLLLQIDFRPAHPHQLLSDNTFGPHARSFPVQRCRVVLAHPAVYALQQIPS